MKTPAAIGLAIYQAARRRLVLGHHTGSLVLFGLARFSRAQASFYRKAARDPELQADPITMTQMADEYAEICRLLNIEYWKGLKK
jgi:hypothetical protein